ncbi:hypothetical protein LI169_20370, partial [Desulfovibrio desulfuricans]|nr:hypothetical protein [Desulfovibrio desulfuricans]
MNQLKGYMQVLASVEVAFDTAGLEGKSFIVTKSGACFRTMKKKYERDLGIIRFKENGYDILWGLDQGRGR